MSHQLIQGTWLQNTPSLTQMQSTIPGHVPSDTHPVICQCRLLLHPEGRLYFPQHDPMSWKKTFSTGFILCL
ncbi:unnamed protein product [Caretta caretta]